MLPRNVLFLSLKVLSLNTCQAHFKYIFIGVVREFPDISKMIRLIFLPTRPLESDYQIPTTCWFRMKRPLLGIMLITCIPFAAA